MNFSSMSIKHKFALALISAVVLSTLIIGTISQLQSRSLLTERIENVELPNILQRIRNQIDKDISILEQAARQMVENPFIVQFMRDGHPKEDESAVVDMLKAVANQYNLTNASVVNRESAHYWNQEGFLRVLQNDNFDGWFFAYRQSGETSSKSLYTEDDVPKLFINYQNVNGLVASGLARTIQDFQSMLNQNRIADTGFVFVVDGKGTVKLHKDSNLIEKGTMSSIFGSQAQQLINKQPFKLLELDVGGEAFYVATSYIPSADWYVVSQVPVSEMFSELDTALWRMVLEITLMSLLFASSAPKRVKV